MGPRELLALAVNRVPFLRPREKLLLCEVCADPGPFARLGLAGLERILGRPIRSRRWDPSGALAGAEGDRKVLTRGPIHCTFIWSDDFPILLREIYDPPLVLYYRGRLPPPDEPLVAIVGTRRPTGLGRRAAFELAAGLARLGIGTVSGLARGIDTEAHRGSLRQRGRTVAVLGNGIDRIFPASSAPVGRRILEAGGCVASEFPPGEPPRPYHFPGRNRIISGLARTVVVVQAPKGSGALITADYALEQGRELAVHAAGLEGPAAEGSRALAEQGAAVTEAAADILAAWAPGLRRGGWKDPWPDPAGAGFAPAAGATEAGPMLARLLERELNGEEAYGA
jgi:DNA processing protein